VLIKYGLSISLHHDLDTHLKRLRDLTGSLLRISAVISGKSIINVFNGGVGFESLGIFLREGRRRRRGAFLLLLLLLLLYFYRVQGAWKCCKTRGGIE